jgi:carotenoid cleavage dioxygenase
MLHAFHVDNGRVAYRNRWVRTPKWELEHAEGEGLSDSFGTAQRSDPRIVALDSTVANTNVVWHGGRLLALEEAHAPVEIDPETLATKGSFDFGGKLVGPMTAHPKLDAVTGEMVFFGYSTHGPFTPDVMLHSIDRHGETLRSRHLVAPYASMVHDFIVTRDWVVLPIFPLTGSLDRAMKGAPPYAWEPEMGTHIGLIPREGPADAVRWFRTDPCFVYHAMNAYDTPEGQVVCDVLKYPFALHFPRPDGQSVSDESPVATLVRWKFDPNRNTDAFSEEALDDHPGEFPRLDERFAGLPYRHGFFQAARPGDASLGREGRNALAHVDLKTGQVKLWRPGMGDYCGEPVFVPRHPAASEGDGFLLSLIFRSESQCSDLAIFDAGCIEDGPLALAHLSHRVPAGFHGNWRGASTAA